MGKYVNKKTSLQVYSGKVKGVSEDRQQVTMVASVYNPASKKYEYQNFTICTSYPVSEAFKQGETVTAVGYPNGPDSILAQHLACGAKSAAYESTDLAVVSGKVVYARLNEEKTQDGSAILTQAGTPRKPHYDVAIDVQHGDKLVHHIIKVYNITEQKLQTNSDGSKQKQPIAEMQNRFKNFVDAEKTPMYVTIVTQPAEVKPSKPKTNENGETIISYYANHMGKKSVDIIPLFKNEKAQTLETPQAAQEVAQPAAPAPAPAPAPAQPTQSAPVFESERPAFAQEVGGQATQPAQEIDNDDIPFV